MKQDSMSTLLVYYMRTLLVSSSGQYRKLREYAAESPIDIGWWDTVDSYNSLLNI